ncbi:MAG: molybdopterin-dependent oxidoreductase [Actinomycetota bacterium]
MAGFDSRRTNLGVFAIAIVSTTSGFATYLVGTNSYWWVFWSHGAIGLSLLALLWWKGKVVLRGLRKRWPSITAVLSIITMALLLAIITTGVWSAVGKGGSLGPWSMLELHVGGALIIIPLFIAHLIGRWVPPAKRDLSRRVLLRASALIGAGAALRLGTDGIAKAVGLVGGKRRFTGSHLIGKPGEPFPHVSWLFEDPDPIDRDAWRLNIVGEVEAELALSYADLAAEPHDRVRATIDCTGGWYSAQDWEGVRLGALLDRARLRDGVRSIVFTSVKGYSRAYPVEGARSLLLATRVSGAELEHGHGFPARVVAPGRRGYWWVKWVTEIEASAAPSWFQPPVPLQ